MEDVTLYYYGIPIRIDSNIGDDVEYVVHQDIYDILLRMLENAPHQYQEVILRR